MPDNGSKQKFWLIDPFVKATFGPVYVEGEVLYKFGKTAAYESDHSAANEDVKLKNSWSAYVMANVTLGPAYVGAAAIYVNGDDKTTNDNEAGQSGGYDFNPCLMLFNYDLGRWNGGMGPTNTPMSGGIINAMIGQIFGGIKPIPKLDVKLSFTYAKAVEDMYTGAPYTDANKYVSKNYGSEVDLTATYKIYDNLSYMLGAGYLFTGDYFKGNVDSRQLDNDYLLTNKLVLTF
jgi:hypothetical protein